MLRLYRIIRVADDGFRPQIWSIRHGWRDITTFALSSAEEAKDRIEKSREYLRNRLVWIGWR